MRHALAQRFLAVMLFNHYFLTTPRYAVFYIPALAMLGYGLYGLRHG